MENINRLKKLLYTGYLLGPGRKKVFSRKKWLEQWKEKSLSQRQDEKNRRFVNLFRYAYDHVPFYHHLYQQQGIKKNDIKSIDDLPKLPIVTREMLASSSLKKSSSFLANPLQRPVSTSGSSGRPLLVNRSMDFFLLQGAQLLQQLDVWNLSGCRKIYFCLYNENPTIAINLPYFLAFSIFNRSHSIQFSKPIGDIYAQMKRETPDVLVTYSSKAEEICDWAIENCQTYCKEIVFSAGAEIVTPSLRQKFAIVFPKGQIYNVYGSVEMGFIGFECPCHCGLHINEWSLLMEEGEKYETLDGRKSFRPIYTDLWNRGTPFIRYAGIDDVMETGMVNCTCGYGHRAIKELQGRVSEMLQTTNSVKIPVSAMVSAHADLQGVKRFQYVQRDKHSLIFRYVPYPNADQHTIRNAAWREVKKFFGDQMSFTCEVVEKIELNPRSGKIPMLVTE